MGTYIGRRLLVLPVVVFGVTLVLFALLQFISPAERAASFVTDPRQLAQLPTIIRTYGLDRPVYVQYWIWLRQVLHGDLGWSQSARMEASTAIATYFPATIELTLYTVVLVIALGIWLGTLAAVHRGRIIDHVSRVLAIGFRGLPTFAWGLLVLMVFYGKLQWFPPG